MKTNNRPMVKETKYIGRSKDGKELLMNTKEDNRGESKGFEGEYMPTDEVREIERPMNDTEYIKYLENNISQFDIERKANIDKHTYEEHLFQELGEQGKVIIEKDNVAGIKETAIPMAIRTTQDQFLKVVESIIQNQIEQAQNPTMMVMLNGMKEHLLQEIKSAVEKGKE